jgi:GT2 family glycosyltransferase
MERPLTETDPLVSIVLVTWNSAPYLRRCLEGITQQTWRNVELIAVDNASSDGSAGMVAPLAAHLIRNDSNRGFSAAVNEALRIARGDFVLLVNPDCYLTPEYASRLVGALEAAGPEFGAAAGMLIRARGTEIETTGEIDSLGIRMTRSGRHLDLAQGVQAEQWEPVARGMLPAASFLPSGAVEVFGVSGAAAMYRTRFLHEMTVDGEALDEDFFAYREDADLAWRGRLAGWRALCEPRAVAFHVRRVTPQTRRMLPPDVNMHSVKNRFLLRIKNQGAYLALRNLPFELLRDVVVIAAALTVERTSLPAFTWLWRNRTRALAKRRAVQSRRVATDRALARWFR